MICSNAIYTKYIIIIIQYIIKQFNGSQQNFGAIDVADVADTETGRFIHGGLRKLLRLFSVLAAYEGSSSLP